MCRTLCFGLQQKRVPILGDQRMAIALDILESEVQYVFPASQVLKCMALGKEPAWKTKNGVAL